MADTLLGALVARFETLFPHVKIYVGEMEENANLPFVVLHHNGEVANWNFEDGYVDEGGVTFKVYQLGFAKAEAIAKPLGTEFSKNWSLITITNAEVLSMLRSRYQVYSESTRGPTGELVYRIELDFITKVGQEFSSSA